MTDEETKTIEERVADTVLQRPTTVTIGTRTYAVAPPTVGTLIRVSEAISRLPARRLNADNVVGEALAVARSCRPVCHIAALLILGEREADRPARPEDTDRPARRRRWPGRLARLVRPHAAPTRLTALARRIAAEASPAELNVLIGRILQNMEIGDFFALTTFLTEINLLRPTKVESATTASGPSSRA